MVIIGGEAPTRLAALMIRSIHATILSPPQLTKAVQAGYRVFADMGDMSANFTQSSLYLKGSSLRENRDRAKRFLKAYAEAVHFIKTDREKRQKSLLRRCASKILICKVHLRLFRPRSFPPRVNLNGIRDTLPFMRSNKIRN